MRSTGPNRSAACDGLIARATANAQAIWEFCAARDWIANLAVDPATASTTSVCLKFTDPRIADGAGFAKAVAKRLEKEGAGLDLGAYRDAPPGLRIWCGSTVELADVAGAAALDRLGIPRRDRRAQGRGLSQLRAETPHRHSAGRVSPQPS